MQYLSRLRVGIGVLHEGLISSETSQDALSYVRRKPHHLQSGNNSVSTKSCREPRDSGVRIRSLRRFCSQHTEVSSASAQHFIEDLICCHDRCSSRSGYPHLPPSRQQCPGKGSCLWRFVGIAAHRYTKRKVDTSCEVNSVACPMRIQHCWLRMKINCRLPDDIVESSVEI